MDLRFFVPAVLLVFGLATVFAQTSAPDQGRSANQHVFCGDLGMDGSLK